MPELTAFDRDRIQLDIEQTTELLSRTEVLANNETDPTKKATLLSTAASLRAELTALEALLK